MLRMYVAVAIFARQYAQFGWTALICAGYHGRMECARLLIDAGADKNATCRVRGRSAASAADLAFCAAI